MSPQKIDPPPAVLPVYSALATLDKNCGVSINGKIPWVSSFFVILERYHVIDPENVIICGRKTYQELISDFNRRGFGASLIFMSRTIHVSDYPDLTICKDFSSALVKASSYKPKKIWVIGGPSIWNLVFGAYNYLCEMALIFQFKADFQCDTFFKWRSLIPHWPANAMVTNTNDWLVAKISLSSAFPHPEEQYLHTLMKIMKRGELQNLDGSPELCLFADTMCRFKINECGFPLFTTNPIPLAQITETWLEMCALLGSDATFMDEILLSRLEDKPHRTLFEIPISLQVGAIVSRIHIHLPQNEAVVDAHALLSQTDVIHEMPLAVAMSAFFLHCIASLLDKSARTLTITVGSATVKVCDLPIMSQIVQRTPLPFPDLKVLVDKDNMTFTDFGFHSFQFGHYARWSYAGIES